MLIILAGRPVILARPVPRRGRRIDHGRHRTAVGAAPAAPFPVTVVNPGKVSVGSGSLPPRRFLLSVEKGR
jgi:hypothetical protein